MSVPSIDALQQGWNATQLGALTQDPIMKPFIEDLERQIKSRLTQSGSRLGITWDDLKGVASGEVAVASVQPNGDRARAATVLLADVTGRQQPLQNLLQKVGRDLVARGAQSGSQTIAGVEFTTFLLPKKKVTDRQATVYYTTHQDQLIVVDEGEVAKELLDRFGVTESPNALSKLPAFVATQQHAAEGFGSDAHVRWFIEPFGYTEVARVYAGGRKKRGTDMLKVLADQGFDCVKGLGGYLAFASGGHEAHHQTYVYAPPVKRASSDMEQHKYNLAARMLDFVNTEKTTPQDWVPERLATYLTFYWKVQEAFWHSESLVNEIAGADVFRDVLNDIEKDPNGPQINVQNEFIQYLGQRLTVVSDYREPITTKSERVILAIEVLNPEAVMAAVNKTMSSDRNAKKIVVDGHTIWEMTQEEDFAVEQIKIEGDVLGGLGEDLGEEPVEEKRFRPNAAVTVAHGSFLIGTHVDYVVEMLKSVKEGERLSDAKDFVRVETALKELGADQDAFRCFTRSDQAYRVTYEMIRQGKMPEAETLLAKLLNGLFAPDDEDSLRPQQIDGSKLPEFEQVQAYLGPAGFYVRADEHGWLVEGCLLKKLP
ncbi:MAG: hypothetical protein AB7F89_01720 [Pirellulaceae bacterium]